MSIRFSWIAFLILCGFVSSSAFCDENDDFIAMNKTQQKKHLAISLGEFFDKNKRFPNSRTELADFRKLAPKSLTDAFDEKSYLQDAMKSLPPKVKEELLTAICRQLFSKLKDNWQDPLSTQSLADLNLKRKDIDFLLGKEDFYDFVADNFTENFEEKRKQILSHYILNIKKRKEFPEGDEFYPWFTDYLKGKLKRAVDLDEKTLKSILRGLFAENDESDEELQDKFNQYTAKNSKLSFVINKKFINEKATKDLLEAVKNHDRFVVSSIRDKQPLTEKRLRALMAYAKKNNAPLFLIGLEYTAGQFDEIISEHDWIHLVFDQVWFSRQWRIASLNVIGKMANPIASAEKIGTRDENIIVGAPKMIAKTISTSGNKQRSKTILGTGSVDGAIYPSLYYNQIRTAFIAEEMHEMGGIVFEKVGDVDPSDRLKPHGEFVHRFIEFSPAHTDHLGVKVEEGFYDLDKHYSVTGNVTDAQPYAIALADTHYPDMTDLLGFTAAIDLIMKRFPNVRQLHLHDFIEGTPFNHHQEGNYRQRAGLTDSQRSIAEQLRQGVKLLNYLTTHLPNTAIKIVESNHPEWINNYINQGKHLKDPENHDIGVDIHAYSVQNKVSPLEAMLLLTQDKHFRRKYNVSPIKNIERVIYAKVGDPHQTDTLIPVMTGMHGHKGAGGARGTKGTKVRGVDRGIFAHDHTFWRERGVMSIGAGFRTADYAKGGFSNWQGPAMGLVYPDGAITHLIAEGEKYEYIRDPDAPPSNPETFFEAGYPKAKEVYTMNNGDVAQDSSAIFSGNGKLDPDNPRYSARSGTIKECSPDIFK